MRRKAALKRLRETNADLYRAEIKRAILASLTRKQMEVVETIRSGQRYIALGCGRRKNAMSSSPRSRWRSPFAD